ncbi:MAG: hypothetical protein KGJ98_04170 [Chloroflexota bacterium]|nr:hypothetical protein [Chloroflexota bacterium]MDE3101412.1 hypothetical protein [Chloroflexota bacterium]
MPRRTEDRVVTRPHAARPYGRVASYAKIAYLFLDTFVGWRLQLLPLVQRGILVIVERPWPDIAVDPRRYRIDVPPAAASFLGRLLPQPDLLLLMRAPAAVLRERKPELPLEETERQLAAWQGVAPPSDRCVHLDAAEPLDIVVERAARAITSAGLVPSPRSPSSCA